MKTLIRAALAAAALACAVVPITASAQLITIGPNGLGIYMFGGHRYCWYDAGWHGGGWYWCGYAERRGLGWGGGEGWHGWDRHGGRGGRPEDRGHGDHHGDHDHH